MLNLLFDLRGQLLLPFASAEESFNEIKRVNTHRFVGISMLDI